MFVCVENDVCEDGVCSVYLVVGECQRKKSLSVVNFVVKFAFLYFVNVGLFCCSLYLVRVFIVMIMVR